MKTQIPRHNNIGEKIREKRKELRMTLGELANGICSVGKLSNIENGHTPVSTIDLKKFSDKLETPISYFSDPFISDKIQDLDYQKQKIKDLIYFKQWDIVVIELEAFKRKIDSYQITSREIDYDFLSGIYYLETNQLYLSEKFLTHVMELKETNNYSLRLKLKAYNAAANLFFTQKKITKSIQMLEKALELSRESPTITKEERDNIYFNLSILNLCAGAYFKALQSVNNVSHYLIDNHETEYIQILIRLLENSPLSDVRKDLLKLREKLQQKKDKEGIIRGWALTLYTSMTYYPSSDLFDTLKQQFWEDMGVISQMDEYKETALPLFQLALFVSITNNYNLYFSQDLVNKTKELLLNTAHKLNTARNYYLEGKFHTEYLSSKDTALNLFQQALDALDNEYNGLLKADILFEISKLKSIKNDAMLALELYHGHFKNQFLFTHFDELILPTFKY
ncbi:helix-turn-helix transcriptional regulator [Bacillus sp. ISL-41]|uniref:helix-turn-helix transcriptional regulator n=1 Tax=Bacillus sp. ISL-41 TaxID=2819127 RepID=UPI001BECC3BC|nr:helix-turn-helix transcriptional regulator [Bacillus sp. ISL-41]MBT2643154.1 helix-turn-helix transcriptional regulator [Bacillus sp. ISL-41]